MEPLATFVVTPVLPERLARLRDLAYNLRWAWDHATIELFRRLDGDLWEASGHNPVRVLGVLPQSRLQELAEDDGFLSHLDGVARFFDDYMAGKATWFRRRRGLRPPRMRIWSAAASLLHSLQLPSGVA